MPIGANLATNIRNQDPRGTFRRGLPLETPMSFLARIVLVGAAFSLAACNPADIRPSGNSNVPQPAKSVELDRYLGKWFEQARYEASFQKDCEGVTADYSLKADGDVRVINTCRQGSIEGPSRSAEATAKVVEGSNGTKLKVTFAWPFEGDYWVLDRANDYSWSIVGEPTGRYLWLLTRSAKPSERQYAALVKRAASLGYDVGLLRRTKQ